MAIDNFTGATLRGYEASEYILRRHVAEPSNRRSIPLNPMRSSFGLIRHSGVAGAVGKTFNRLISAEPEGRISGAPDRPPAVLLGQLKQRTAVPIVYWYFIASDVNLSA
jgi:hypothetical protein